MAEVTEVESGKRTDRPKLAEALKLCRLHGATLIIAKLDRLARNVAFISNLMESGVEFHAVDFPNLPDGRRAKAAIRLENRQALAQPFLKALFAISRWSGLKRAWRPFAR
jgi:DNA invertase Pin-like site-specific DNA recombinase